MSAKQILVVGSRWLGDMIMSQSLVAMLLEKYPGSVVDILAPKTSIKVTSRMPGVRRGIAYTCKRSGLSLRDRYLQGCELRPTRYDMAIVWPRSWKSALIPWMARIPVRRGWIGEQRYGLLNQAIKLDKSRFPSLIQQLSTLVYDNPDPNLSMVYPTLRIDRDQVDFYRERYGLGSERLVVVAPGAAQSEAKRWTPEHFASVIQVMSRCGWRVALMGAPSDTAVGAQIETLLDASGVAVMNWIGKTSLVDAVDHLAMAEVVISNDSGLMHMAAALSKAVIGIYGPTPTGFCPILTEKQIALSLDLDCMPCRKGICPLKHHRCMVDLLPQQVLNAVDSLVGLSLK